MLIPTDQHCDDPWITAAAIDRISKGRFLVNIVVGGNSKGLTVTSLFADPACLIVSVNQNASTYPILKNFGHFGVNILPARLQAVVAAVGDVPQRYAKLRCFYLVLLG